jgi:hypothetical protein
MEEAGDNEGSKMKTFQEWMEDNHPESIDEGLLNKIVLGGALAAGAAGALGWGGNVSDHSGRPGVTRNDDMDEEEDEMEAKSAKLQAAAQRVGIPRSQWGKLKGHMTGGIVTVVNGKRVPLTPREAAEVKAVQKLARSMGN